MSIKSVPLEVKKQVFTKDIDETCLSKNIDYYFIHSLIRFKSQRSLKSCPKN